MYPADSVLPEAFWYQGGDVDCHVCLGCSDLASSDWVILPFRVSSSLWLPASFMVWLSTSSMFLGRLFVDQKCDPKIRASAQGLFMLMTNGLGATIGTLLAGQVINHYCQFNEQGYLMGDWRSCWLIFAGYALVVAVLFAFLFKPKKQN